MQKTEVPKVETGKGAIDDAQFKKLMADSKPSFFEKNKYRLVTLCLIAINLIVYIVEVVFSGSVSISSRVLVNMGAMFSPDIQSVADLYRFIAPMFLHVDLMHIAFNMVALYSVGGALERVLGKGNFLLLYFIAGITGNMASYVSDVYITHSITVSAGASTSIFGLFVAVAMMALLFKGNRQYFKQVGKSMLVIIAINVAYSFLVPDISISGHLGGALGGLIAMFMVPSKNLRVPNIVRVLVTLAWVGAITFILFDQGII